MNPKSGTAGSPVAPVAPTAAEEADVADPGEVEEVKARDRQLQSGKYGSVQVKPFKPPQQSGSSSQQNQQQQEEEELLSWIEIELVGEDDKPIPGEKYEIALPDGSVASGTLDQKGFARVEGFKKGQCQISFPDLDQDAWEKI